MNILYINHYAGSVYHGMEYRPYYLAREWVKLGFTVTIVAADYSHLRNRNLFIPEGEDYLIEYIDGIRYIWCRTPKYEGNGIKRVINIFTFLYRLYKLRKNILYDTPLDLVVASSTYPFDTILAAKIAKKAQAKFVYEVHDLWPLTPIELSGISKYHPFIFLMQRAENFGYKKADKVVSLLPKAKTYMIKHGLQGAKFIYIPNGVPVDDWQQMQESLAPDHYQQIKSIRQQYSFLIGYAGGMGDSNALDFLLDAAAKLQDSGIAFILVGNGTKKEDLIKRLQVEDINNVFALPAINKNAVPAFLAHMDALYIGWNNLSIYRFGICPNKLFDYMLAAKPILHSVTAGNDLVHEANCGISVPAEDIDGIVNAALKLSKLPKEKLSEFGYNGYQYVKAYHDYKILANLFITQVWKDTL